MKTFFRVNHEDTQQGLWYDFLGTFTGNIHWRYKFCKNTSLQMDFDPEIVGYISAVETIEQLMEWFPVEDILKLQEHGYYIHEYEATDYKWYERFSHFVIKQSSSKVVRKIVLVIPSFSVVVP